jgi:hypothetical protein
MRVSVPADAGGQGQYVSAFRCSPLRHSPEVGAADACAYSAALRSSTAAGAFQLDRVPAADPEGPTMALIGSHVHVHVHRAPCILQIRRTRRWCRRRRGRSASSSRAALRSQSLRRATARWRSTIPSCSPPQPRSSRRSEGCGAVMLWLLARGRSTPPLCSPSPRSSSSRRSETGWNGRDGRAWADRAYVRAVRHVHMAL